MSDLAPNNAVKQLEDALPDRPVSAVEAMEAIVKADGDIMMASVLLKCKVRNILVAIVTDQANADLMAGYFRTFTMLKAFQAASAMHDRVMDSMDDLNPKDLASVYVKALDAFSKFVEKDNNTTPQGNPLDLLRKSLPSDVRDAFDVLIGGASSPQTPNELSA